MSRILLIVLAVTLQCLSLTACKKPGNGDITMKEVAMTEDTKSLLRNPAMGWNLYDDAYDHVADADTYWSTMDRYAREYASCLYIRWRWSELESEEGIYAWDDPNSNFSKLIAGARERGLHIAFRIIYDSGDNVKQSTPEYVRKAGAQGYTYEDKFITDKLTDYSRGSLWSPFPDDPVFKEKYEKFIAAFADRFDDPTFVDYIDALALGMWGECWFVPLSDKTIGGTLNTTMSPKHKEVFTWFTDVYSRHFKNVLLCFNVLTETDMEFQINEAVRKKGYVMRRDGLGSAGFHGEINKINTMFPEVCFFSESYYWMINQPYNPTNDYYKSDPMFGTNGNGQYKSWRDVLIQTYNHAIDSRANTLDMREAGEAENWDTNAKDYIQNFIIRGGYRFFPVKLQIPETIKNGSILKINHQWVNRGVGMLPNHKPQWNYKYKPAFAIIDKDGKTVKVFVDTEAEPSTWLFGKKASINTLETTLDGVKAGKYRLATAIVNTQNDNRPEIKLAIKEEQVNGWYIISNINIE